MKPGLSNGCKRSTASCGGGTLKVQLNKILDCPVGVEFVDLGGVGSTAAVERVAQLVLGVEVVVATIAQEQVVSGIAPDAVGAAAAVEGVVSVAAVEAIAPGLAVERIMSAG